MHATVVIDRHEVPVGPEITADANMARRPKTGRDDRENVGKEVEPAMAGIPAGAVRKMPQLASPGLPPVDPVEVASVVADDGSGCIPSRSAHKAAQSVFSICADVDGESADRFPGVRLIEKSRHSDAGTLGQVSRSPGTVLKSLDEGLGWLVLPVNHTSFSLGNDPSEPVRIALAPATVSAIVEVLQIGALNAGSDRFGALSSHLASSADFDSRNDGSSIRERSAPRRAPDRVAARPRPDQWGDDELVTLPEAARLFWPDGPLTTTTLRTAARDGQLEIRTVAGRHMTTPAALRRLGMPRPEGAATGPTVAEAAASMLGRLERRR